MGKTLVGIVAPNNFGKSCALLSLYRAFEKSKNAELVEIIYPKKKIQHDVVAIFNVKLENGKIIKIGVSGLGDHRKQIVDSFSKMLDRCDIIIFACRPEFANKKGNTEWIEKLNWNYITTSVLHNNYAPRISLKQTAKPEDHYIVDGINLNEIFIQNIINLINNITGSKIVL
ncbi:MAG: hypothetical protein KBS99_02390 [Prevotellaceae bacterium]|nr:hypothetical protein [Candidatus Colivivens caballi]